MRVGLLATSLEAAEEKARWLVQKVKRATWSKMGDHSRVCTRTKSGPLTVWRERAKNKLHVIWDRDLDLNFFSLYIFSNSNKRKK